MSSSPSVPTVPNPSGVAQTQTGLNTTAGEQSQAGSMVNQNNAYGGLNYVQTGTNPDGTPMYTANTSLSPTEQNLFNQYTSTQATAGGQAGALLNSAGYGSVPAATAIGNATSGLTGQAVQQEEQYLQPFFGPQTSQLDTQLRNQGFDPSSPAYQQAMNNLLQSQGQTETGFVANIEPQMFQQATSTYELPAQLAGSLASLGAPTTPNSSFVQTPGLSVTPANYEGDVSSANTANMAAYQAQVTQNNAMMSGLFGLGSAALGGLASGGLTTALGGSNLLGAGGLGYNLGTSNYAGLTNAQQDALQDSNLLPG